MANKGNHIMQVDLRGKVALVTGSAHRVGKAIALGLAREGAAQVIHFGGSAEKAAATVAEVRALGVDAIRCQADLSAPDQIAGLFAAIESHFGRLDILVNSASVFQRADLATLSLADWNATLAINLTAPFLCTQHAVALMRRHGGGAIVNISDNSGLRAAPNYPHHSVSKAGLVTLTQVSALALAPDIRVNAVVPGLVMQPPDYSDAQWAKLATKSPLQRAGNAEDVARAVVYLAREDYITGTVITVDGGENIK
jgi:pteridine reductase